MEPTPVLSRYDVAHIVGMRSLHLSCGAPPLVHVDDEHLRENTMYVAARELKERRLDVVVRRGERVVRVADARLPPCVDVLLGTLGPYGSG